MQICIEYEQICAAHVQKRRCTHCPISTVLHTSYTYVQSSHNLCVLLSVLWKQHTCGIRICYSYTFLWGTTLCIHDNVYYMSIYMYHVHVHVDQNWMKREWRGNKDLMSVHHRKRKQKRNYIHWKRKKLKYEIQLKENNHQEISISSISINNTLIIRS